MLCVPEKRSGNVRSAFFSLKNRLVTLEGMSARLAEDASNVRRGLCKAEKEAGNVRRSFSSLKNSLLTLEGHFSEWNFGLVTLPDVFTRL